MASSNGSNPYGVPYSLISWFEISLIAHDNVLQVSRHDDVIFEVTRKKQRDVVTIFCADDYICTISHVMTYVRDFPSIQCICIGGNWNQSTREAEEFCKQRKISICNARELFSSLQWDIYESKVVRATVIDPAVNGKRH